MTDVEAAGTAGRISEQELASRQRALHELMELIAGEVAKDGGTAALLSAEFETGVIAIRLGGACGSCSLTGATLEDGIERILRQRLDWVTEICGEVEDDHGVMGFGGWQPRN